MASLFKKSSGYFYAAFHCAERKPTIKQVALKTTIKREAEKRIAELEGLYEQGKYDPWHSAKPQRSDDLDSLQGAVEAFVRSRLNLSPYTVTKYRSVLGLFVGHLGASYPTKRIKPDHVEAFLNASARKAVTKKTYSTTLSPFFNWLKGKGIIDSNPAEGLRLERVPQKIDRYLMPDDVQAICRAIKATQQAKRTVEDCGEWLIPIVRANVFLGLRAGELVNLEWKHVDFERRTLTVACTETFKTKSGKVRVLPLCDAVLDVLRRLERRSIYVFPNYGGTQLHRMYLSRAFKHFARKAGRHHLNFHATRHTAASWLAMNGATAEAIRLYMGHSSITVSQRYMHFSPQMHFQQINTAFGKIAA